jgi:uncharacterized protein YlxW (UPF0749 family)
MALITAVWIAGYVVQKSISTAVSFAWSAVSSTKQGQEAYEERKQRLASQASAAETAQLRAEVRRLQAAVERLEAADRERYDLVIDQR